MSEAGAKAVEIKPAAAKHGFQPGQSGNPAGRPKGIPNRATSEVIEVSRGLVNGSKYRETLQARLESGDVSPAVETMLWYYAFGKPKEIVSHEGVDGAPLIPTLNVTLKRDNP